MKTKTELTLFAKKCECGNALLISDDFLKTEQEGKAVQCQKCKKFIIIKEKK